MAKKSKRNYQSTRKVGDWADQKVSAVTRGFLTEIMGGVSESLAERVGGMLNGDNDYFQRSKYENYEELGKEVAKFLALTISTGHVNGAKLIRAIAGFVKNALQTAKSKGDPDAVHVQAAMVNVGADIVDEFEFEGGAAEQLEDALFGQGLDEARREAADATGQKQPMGGGMLDKGMALYGRAVDGAEKLLGQSESLGMTYGE